MKDSIKKELRSWGVIAAIALVLYLGGWHTQVISYLQRALLATGLIRPNTEQVLEQASGELPEVDLNFTLRDGTGALVSMEQFRGKVLFINLWATWCPPCLAEMPGINKLYESFEEEEVVFLMLSVDKDFSKAITYVNDQEFSFPVYQVAGGWPPELNSSTIPTTFVMDKTGRLVLKHAGMAKYNTGDFKTFLRSLL